MNVRTTAVLALVAVLLGAYVWWVEVGGTQKSEEAEAASKKVLELEAEAVTALELPLGGDGTARLARDPDDPDRWRLEKPLDYPADSGTVSGILSTLTQLASEAVIEDPGDLAPFGLADEPPRLVIVLEGGETRTLYLGGEAPLGSARYVRVEGEDRVLTVANWRTSTLRPRLRTLRDKRVTHLAPDDVTRLWIREHGILLVELGWEGGADEEPAAEARERGEWRILAPIEEAADAKRVRRLLDDLHFLRANEFIDEPGKLEDYGIDRPEITIALEAGDAREVLELGRGGGNVYLRSSRTPVIFRVYDRTLADVPRELFAYREKAVLSVDEDAIARLELAFPRDGDIRHSFVREEGAWKPDGEAVAVDALRIEDVVYATRELEAVGLEERSVEPSELGLDPPGVRITFRDPEGAELGWIELGDLDPDRGIAARSSRNDRIWWLKEELGEDVPLSHQAFRNRFLEGTDSPAKAGDADPNDPSSE